MDETVFFKLSDDVVLNILFKLDDDPRHWARIACVSTKFASLVRTLCFRTKCTQSIPAVVSDLIASSAGDPLGGWASLYKLAVCCPGLLHSGVLLENSDFGLEREIGPDECCLPRLNDTEATASSNDFNREVIDDEVPTPVWSLYDDLMFDTLYNDSESTCKEKDSMPECPPDVEEVEPEFPACKRRKVRRVLKSHLASGVWNLSREQGNKLLASRFKDDCLYVCYWPGCVHIEEKRSYMLFRGMFKNFKQSRVWRTINDGNKSKVDLNCAFCASNETWDLHSSFCLRRYFGYHDDGEPVVRAYVCENGHVSGAWTDWPMYN